MVIWPIVNLLFVVLVGYDADLAQAVRRLHSCLCNCSLPQHSSPTQRVQHRNNGNAGEGGGRGGNIDSYYSSSLSALPCMNCGHVRRSSVGGGNSTSIPMFRRIWSDSRIIRQQPISRTPSFLATTTMTSISTTDTRSTTSQEGLSPAYYSAVQSSSTLPYNNSSMLEFSPQSQQQQPQQQQQDLSSSNDCLANAFYDSNLLTPSRSRSPCSSTSVSRRENSKSDNNTYSGNKSATIYDLQQQQREEKHLPASSKPSISAGSPPQAHKSELGTPKR